MNLIRRHVILIYGLITLSIHELIIISSLQYDDGFSGILIITWPVWGVVYWLPNELLFALNNDLDVKAQKIISITVGLGFCFSVDYLINYLRNRKNR